MKKLDDKKLINVAGGLYTKILFNKNFTEKKLENRKKSKDVTNNKNEK